MPVEPSPAKGPVPVAVVLLNYNGWKDTLACIDSLLLSERGVARIIVCDNASPDGSFQHLRDGLASRRAAFSEAWRRWAGQGPGAVEAGQHQDLQVLTRAQVIDGAQPEARVVLIDNGGNWGFARGNNVGLELAVRDQALRYFWLLNNDTEVPATTIGHLADACDRRPDVGLWGGTVVYHGQPELVQALGGGALNHRTAETRHIGAFFDSRKVDTTPGLVSQVESEMDYALGACMWATRPWVERAGLLGEHYFLYYEEIDWALRGRRWFSLGYEPKAVVLHKEGASIGTSPSGGSALSVFHLVRSRLIFARLHLPATRLPGVLIKAAVQALKYVVKRRVPLASATLRGAWAGWSAK